MKTKLLLLGCALLAFNPRMPILLAQGSLTPPAAPGPAMKSLDQIDSKLEKRTPISSLPFTISQRGSYYFTQNLSQNGSGGGITISADSVTLDLNGFALIGNFQGNATAIAVPGNNSGICIRNGTIFNWDNGGISMSATGYDRVVEDMRVRQCQNFGISTNGSASQIRRCSVSLNVLLGAGIKTSGYGSIVTDCIAGGADATAFELANGSVIINCMAYVSNPVGIHVGEDSAVIHCTATSCGIGIRAEFGSTVKDSSVGHNGTGFHVANGCTISNCTARADGVGFEITDNCYVLANTADSTPAGFTIGNGNRVDGNTASANSGGAGFVVNGSNNLIIRNGARATVPQSNQYPFGAGATNNTFGVVIDVHNGGATISNQEAWANFVY